MASIRNKRDIRGTRRSPGKLTGLHARCTCPYAVRYRDGDTNASKSFSTRKLAEDFQAQLLRDTRAGERVFSTQAKANEPFNEYAAAWIERGQSRNERTKAVYRSTFKKIAPLLAGRSLSWVASHRREVEDVINSLKGTSYHRRARVIIVSSCNYAVQHDDIRGHRLRGLDIGRDVRITPAKFYPATMDELTLLADELGDVYSLVVWAGRFGGLRLGESLGLNEHDVLTEPNGKKVIVLQRQRLQDGTLDALKGRQAHEFRTIPVNALLASKLAQAVPDEAGFYFPVQWRRTVQDRFSSAVGRAGLPSSFVPHSLRHLFASDLLSQGARLDLVSKILGHRSVEITSSVYAHQMPSDFDNIRSLLAA